jgi:hypothetical protein
VTFLVVAVVAVTAHRPAPHQRRLVLPLASPPACSVPHQPTKFSQLGLEANLDKVGSVVLPTPGTKVPAHRQQPPAQANQ